MKFARSSESARNSSTVRRRLIYCFQFYIINDEWMIERKKKKKIGRNKRGRKKFHSTMWSRAVWKCSHGWDEWQVGFINERSRYNRTRVRDIYLKKKKMHVMLNYLYETCSINKQIVSRTAYELLSWLFEIE